MAKTKKQYLEDYKKVRLAISEGYEDETWHTQLNNIMTIKDLKKAIEGLDDNMPVFVENYDDPLTLTQNPLRLSGVHGELQDNLESEFFVLSSVPDKDFLEWSEEVDYFEEIAYLKEK